MLGNSWTGRVTPVVLAAGALVGLVAGPALAAAPGAAGAGDPYFPLQGNGGYDVGHYDLTFSFTPATGRLDGVARISATTTGSLSRFDLDLRRTLTVSKVLVDGRPAAFRGLRPLHRAALPAPARPAALLRRLALPARQARRLVGLGRDDGDLGRGGGLVRQHPAEHDQHATRVVFIDRQAAISGW